MLNYIKIIEIPFLKKSFGFQIRKSSDGRWQISNKENTRHIPYFSINKVLIVDEPALINIIFLAWAINILLVDFAFFDTKVDHMKAYQPGKGIHDCWKICNNNETIFTTDRNEVKKIAPYYIFHDEY